MALRETGVAIAQEDTTPEEEHQIIKIPEGILGESTITNTKITIITTIINTAR